MGRVVSGMDAVDAIAPGEPPAEPTKIVRAWLGDDSTASAATK
jgi:peptidylprolyl isomerase